MKNPKTIIAAIIIAAAASIGYLYSTGNLNFNQLSLDQTQPTEEAVARVNGEVISNEEYQNMRAQVAAQQGMDINTLDDQTANQLKEQTLDILISRTLLEQAAEETGATASDEDVTAEIDALKNQLGSQEALDEALVSQNMTQEELQSQIQSDLTTQAYLDQTIDQSSLTATEDEITQAYESVADTQEVPPLEEVRDQVEQSIIRQKQQASVQQLTQELRAQADIEILI